MGEVSTENVVFVLQAVERYFLLTLAREELTPDAAMGREDVLQKVQTLLERLEKGASLSMPPPRPPKEPVVEEEETEELYDDAAAVNSAMASAEESNDAIAEEEYVVPIDQGHNEPQEGDQLYEVDMGPSSVAANQGIQEAEQRSPSTEPGEMSEAYLMERLNTLQKVSPGDAKEGCVLSGHLQKHKKKFLTNWRKRFCVIKDSFLFYFKSETENKEKGVIVLPFYTIAADQQDIVKNIFKLNPLVKGRDSYQFMTENQTEFQRWFGVLETICKKSIGKRNSQIIYDVTKEMDKRNQRTEGGSEENSAGEAITPMVTPGPLEQETYDFIEDPNLKGPQPEEEEIEEELYDDVAGAIESEQLKIQVPQQLPQNDRDIPVEPIEPEFYEDIPGDQSHAAPQPEPEPIVEDIYEDIPGASLPQPAPPRPRSPALPRPRSPALPHPRSPLLQQRRLPSEPKEAPPRLPERNPVHAPAVISAPDTQVESDDLYLAPEKEEVKKAIPKEDFLVENLYVGLYDCSIDEEDELPFSKGDYIYILDRVDVNWWIGYLQGKVGLVPKSYIQEAFP